MRDAGRTHISGCTSDGVGGDNVFLAGQLDPVEGCMFTSIGDQGSVAANGVALEYGAEQSIVTNNQFRAVGALSKGAITLSGTGSVANNNLGGA